MVLAPLLDMSGGATMNDCFIGNVNNEMPISHEMPYLLHSPIKNLFI